MAKKNPGKRSRRLFLSPDAQRPAPRTPHTDFSEADMPPASTGDFIDYRDEETLAQFLLALIKQANRPLQMDEILRIAKLPRKAKKNTEHALYALQDSGRVLRAAGGWATAQGLRTVEGVLAVQRAGMGFVTPATGKGQDIYIHPTALLDAWHGDTVEVQILPGKRGPNVEGRISRIVHHATTELMVHALHEKLDGVWVCEPVNPRIQGTFLVDTSTLQTGVTEKDLLTVTLGKKITTGLWAATASVNMQNEESAEAQERVAKSNHAIPSVFPPAVFLQANALPASPQEADWAGRQDLRHIDFVTIDGETARDFDDAIYVEPVGNGYRLLVGIADVSHYVHQGSALDAEARLRGNSYYFPLSVEPMLPEALCDGLCSLLPDVPRLVMVAEMHYSATGQVGKCTFYPAVIVSKARLTYDSVHSALLQNNEDEQKKMAHVLPMLRHAESLAKQMTERRKERGSLDFDLPEAQIDVDAAGNITRISQRERHFAHRLIEEFMIAANEAVGRFLEQKNQPALYRIHPAPSPEKLTNLVNFLESSGLGHHLPAGKPSRGKQKKEPVLPTAHDLRRIMASVANTPQEYGITRMILRSMMQAKYAAENEGHFGLASPCYCHFTSPIRRYADLLVHRALKDALGLPLKPDEHAPSLARLEEIATHINATERTAMEAEREVHKRLTVLFLRDKVGETFAGIISGITDFGFFVEIPQFMADGMVRLATIGDDFYEYNPDRQELLGRNSRRAFRMGQEVRVTLSDVSLARQEINLVLEGSTPVAGRSSRSGITVTGRKSRPATPAAPAARKAKPKRPTGKRKR